MNDLGNTFIENFNTFPPSNTWLEWIKILATPFATLIIGLFTVYITVVNLRRTMLDNLDSKSGWRKKLFEIAGTSNITMKEVHQLRASVRFDYKKDSSDNIIQNDSFEGVTNLIIIFCDSLNTLDNNECKLLTLKEQEMVRVFCRYLLADQWEKLQLSQTESFVLDNKKGTYSISTYIKCTLIHLLFLNKINTKVSNWKRKETQLINYTKTKYKELIDSNI